jgi:hypothetical protein
MAKCPVRCPFITVTLHHACRSYRSYLFVERWTDALSYCARFMATSSGPSLTPRTPVWVVCTCTTCVVQTFTNEFGQSQSGRLVAASTCTNHRKKDNVNISLPQVETAVHCSFRTSRKAFHHDFHYSYRPHQCQMLYPQLQLIFRVRSIQVQRLLEAR